MAMTDSDLLFPLFTCCKFIINDKIPNKDGKLFKLFTNKLNFKINSVDPLVIEKDWPSQEDITELVEALKEYLLVNSKNCISEDNQGETSELWRTKENIQSGDSERISPLKADTDKQLTKHTGIICNDASINDTQAAGNNDVKHELIKIDHDLKRNDVPADPMVIEKDDPLPDDTNKRLDALKDLLQSHNRKDDKLVEHYSDSFELKQREGNATPESLVQISSLREAHENRQLTEYTIKNYCDNSSYEVSSHQAQDIPDDLLDLANSLQNLGMNDVSNDNENIQKHNQCEINSSGNATFQKLTSTPLELENENMTLMENAPLAGKQESNTHNREEDKKQVEITQPEYLRKQVETTQPEYLGEKVDTTQPEYHRKQTETTQPDYLRKQVGTSQPEYPRKQIETTQPEYLRKQVETTQPEYPRKQIETTQPEYPRKQVETTQPEYLRKQIETTQPEYLRKKIETTQPEYLRKQVATTQPEYLRTQVETTQPEYPRKQIETTQPEYPRKQIETTQPEYLRTQVETTQPEYLRKQIETTQPEYLRTQVETTQPEYPRKQIETTQPEYPRKQIETTQPEYLRTQVETTQPEYLRKQVATTQPEYLRKQVETTQPDYLRKQVDTTQPEYLRKQVDTTQPEYLRKQVDTTQPEYLRKQVDTTQPEYLRTQVETTQPEYPRKQIETTQPEYPRKQIETTQPEYLRTQVETTQPEYLRKQVATTQPEYLRKQVETTQPEYPRKQVETTQPEYPRKKVEITQPKYPRKQVETTQPEYPRKQVDTTQPEYLRKQIENTQPEYPRKQVETTQSEYPRKQVETTQPEYLRKQVDTTQPEYLRKQVDTTQPEYLRTQVETTQPEYPRKQIETTQPEYPRKQIETTQPEYLRTQVETTQPEYLRKQVATTQPEYLRKQVETTQPDYLRKQVDTTLPEYLRKQVDTTQPAYLRKQVDTTQPEYPGKQVDTTQPEYPRKQVETTQPEYPRKQVETTQPEYPRKKVEITQPKYPRKQVETTQPEYPRKQVDTTQPEYLRKQIENTQPEYPRKQVETTQSEYPRKQVETTQPEYPRKQVETTQPEYPRKQVKTTQPEYPRKQVETTQSEYPRKQVVTTQPEYLRKQVDTTQPEYLRKQVETTQPEYLRKQVETTQPEYPRKKVEITQPEYPRKQVETTQPEYLRKQVETTQPEYPRKQVETTQPDYLRKQVDTTQSEYPRKQVETTQPEYPRKQVEITQPEYHRKQVETTQPEYLRKQVDTTQPEYFRKQVATTQPVYLRKQVETTQPGYLRKQVEITQPEYLRKQVETTQPEYLRKQVDTTQSEYPRKQVETTQPDYLRKQVATTQPEYLRTQVETTQPDYLRKQVETTQPEYIGEKVKTTQSDYLRKQVDTTQPDYLRKQVETTQPDYLRKQVETTQPEYLRKQVETTQPDYLRKQVETTQPEYIGEKVKTTQSDYLRKQDDVAEFRRSIVQVMQNTTAAKENKLDHKQKQQSRYMEHSSTQEEQFSTDSKEIDVTHTKLIVGPKSNSTQATKTSRENKQLKEKNEDRENISVEESYRKTTGHMQCGEHAECTNEKIAENFITPRQESLSKQDNVPHYSSLECGRQGKIDNHVLCQDMQTIKDNCGILRRNTRTDMRKNASEMQPIVSDDANTNKEMKMQIHVDDKNKNHNMTSSGFACGPETRNQQTSRKKMSDDEKTNELRRYQKSEFNEMHQIVPVPRTSERDVHCHSSSRSEDSYLKHKADKTTYSVNSERCIFSKGHNIYYAENEKSKLKVQILNTDITKLEVDCIVTAANKRLQHGAGVAKAISSAAGPALKKECEDFIQSGNQVAVTDIFVSTGGKMPAKCVIHAVGPKWESYGDNSKSQCLQDLRHTVIRCLVEADRRGFTSIALPSISAGTFKVPKEACARCYMEAVKHFDILNGEQTSLRDIRFVDVDDVMVTIMQEHFQKNWTNPCDYHTLHEGAEFAKAHDFSAAKNSAKNTEKLLDTRKLTSSSSSSPVSTKTPGASKSSSVVGDTSRSSNTVASGSDLREERNSVYQIGKFTLHTDTRPAFNHSADITITVGKPFDKLSGLHDFSVSSNMKTKEGLKNTFKVFSVSKPKGQQEKLVCALLPEPDDADTIKKAIGNLSTIIQSPNKKIFMQNIKNIVLTSSILYDEPSNTQKKGKKHTYDRKKVGDFARCLFDYLDHSSGNTALSISITLVGNEEALQCIHTVLESRHVKKISSEDIGSSTDSERACVICAWPRPLYPVRCCGQYLCQTCEQRMSICPFCRTFLRVSLGNQPQGTMSVYTINDHADGYENTRVWEINYSFPAGLQKEYHQNPGKMYTGISRKAFLPINEEGRCVLKLLRLAFLRKLTFTIGRSLTTDRENSIIWNDIQHKTNLHGGPHGYPDSNYFYKVKQELASKGVTFDTMSEVERYGLEYFEQCIVKLGYFTESHPK